MAFSRISLRLIIGLIPFFLFSGCGDLESEMQDTRSVVLKMNFNQRSSSRSSQISQTEINSHNTHLILALPAWEQLSSNYKNYYSNFAQELMNSSDRKVSLEIPLNTQIKILAFLFRDDYTMPQLFSGVREVGYYGESQPFSIGTNTNNLRLNIILQSTGTSTVQTGNIAPVIKQVTAIASPTSDSTPNYIFESTEQGTINYGGSCSSSTTSASPGNNTITFNVLSNGTYSDCTIKITDADGNESNILTIPEFTVNTTASSSTTTTIAVGLGHSCAILDNGNVKCWGYNNSGQLGIDNSTKMGDDHGEMAQLTGINFGTGRTATAIAVGLGHSCAKLDNGVVKCWGQNNNGQLGIDNSTSMGDDHGEMAQLTGINLGTGRTATAITAGYYHNCAKLDNRDVKCWGYNNNGQLGIDNTTKMGDNDEMAQLTGINLGTGRTATAITAGYYRSCALMDNGAVKCWGRNNYGQLGIDNTTKMGDDHGEMSSLPSINL
ncbi:hypothetical protein OAK48_04260 [Deltaproteobacteria bacterium]|nr:hypothetical protein [Deltaproteobacteria bacterium]